MINEKPSSTTRAELKEQRRNALLRGALAEFNEKGFRGASTRAITSAAGISSGLLFHYFASKEELYEELVRIGCEEMEVDPAAGLGDPLGFLNGMVDRVLALLGASPSASAMFTFMARAERTPGISAVADQLLSEHEVMRVLVPTLAEGQRVGVVRPGAPEALALAFWSALQGLAEAVAVSPLVPLPEADWLLSIVRHPESGK